MNKKGCAIDGLKMMNKKVVWIKKIKNVNKKIKKLWIKKIKKLLTFISKDGNIIKSPRDTAIK